MTGEGKRIRFDRPWLILCEGPTDLNVLHQIKEFYNLHPGKFTILYPSLDRDEYKNGGVGKFGVFLTDNRDLAEFKANVKLIGIVADADEDRNESMRVISKTLADAGLPAPANEMEVATMTGFPPIIVSLFPKNSPGNIETICVEASLNKWRIKGALNKFMSSTPSSKWVIGKKSKMQMQAILAATCMERPDTSLSHIWQRKQDYHPPISDQAFTDLRRFLEDFPTFF